MLKKIILIIGLITILIVGIPGTVVGFNNLKVDPKLIKDKITEKKVADKAVGKEATTKEENAEKTLVAEDVKINVYYVPEKRTISLPMEEYIKLVVASEMPASFNEEALKAQSIAARSFLVPKLKAANGKGCPKANGADVCSDVHCQAFFPKEERMKSWGAEGEVKWKKVSDAVDATKGQVLIYDNKIATSIKYFSTSGGKTEDSAEVFGSAQPYLKSVESKGEEVAPNFKSTVSIKRSDFVAKIKAKYKDAKIDDKNLEKQIKITEKTQGDRVKAINIGGKVLTGVEMRSIFGLKSAGFTLSFDKENVIFNVSGYGHGVGMSQWGANEMGKAGKNYKEILTHYYTNIKIDDYKKYIK